MLVALIRHAPTPGNLEGRYVGGSTDEALGGQGRALAGRAGRALGCLRPGAVVTSGMRRCDETATLLFPGAGLVRVAGLAEMRFGAFEGKTFAELDGDADYQAWVDSGGTAACPGGESQAGFVERACAALTRALDGLADLQAEAGKWGTASEGGQAGTGTASANDQASLGAHGSAMPGVRPGERPQSTPGVLGSNGDANVGEGPTRPPLALGAASGGAGVLRERQAAFVVHAGTVMAVMSALAVGPAAQGRGYWDWKAPYCGGFAVRAYKTENGWRLADARALPRPMM